MLVGIALIALIAAALGRHQLVSAGNDPSGAVWALAMLGATALLAGTTVGWAALAVRAVRSRPAGRRGTVVPALIGASLFLAVLAGAYALGPLIEAEVLSSFRGVWLLGVSAVVVVLAGRRWLVRTLPERRIAALVGIAAGAGALAAGRLWTTIGDAGFSSFPAYAPVWLLVMLGAAVAVATATAVSAFAALRLVPLTSPRGGVAAGSTPVEANFANPEPRLRWRDLTFLVGITILAAALRFPALGLGGYWGDEAFTVWIVRMDFGGMLATVSQTESNPPLYYMLGWGWSKVFGTGELGLRSLSALVGTATVPVVYAAARTLVSGRAGVVAAVLVALSPVLLGFSGEARNYALVSFLGAACLLFFARALGDPSPRRLWAWALASILALATHYFALFLIAPAAAWLVVTTPRRRALAAPLAAIGAAGALLTPLAIEQASHSYAGWIGGIALSDRLWQTVHLFAVGPESLEDPLTILIYTVLALGVWLLLTRASGPERRGGLLAAGLGLSVIAVPLALESVGVNYFFYRNEVAAVPLLAVAVGAGFGARKAGWTGLAGATALGALSVAVLAWGLAAAPERPPADWRNAAKAVGPPVEDRAVLMLGRPSSPAGPHPLDLYLFEAEPLAGPPRPVREIAVVEERAETPAPLRAAGEFRMVERRVTAAFVITRLRSPRAVAVPPEALALRQPGRRITHGWLQRRGTPGAGEDRPPALGRSVL
ncbi:MAG: glycosyltransferase family 39 protein [Thermoleophilaceae bacterium]